MEPLRGHDEWKTREPIYKCVECEDRITDKNCTSEMAARNCLCDKCWKLVLEEMADD